MPVVARSQSAGSQSLRPGGVSDVTRCPGACRRRRAAEQHGIGDHADPADRQSRGADRQQHAENRSGPREPPVLGAGARQHQVAGGNGRQVAQVQHGRAQQAGAGNEVREYEAARAAQPRNRIRQARKADQHAQHEGIRRPQAGQVDAGPGVDADQAEGKNRHADKQTVDHHTHVIGPVSPVCRVCLAQLYGKLTRTASAHPAAATPRPARRQGTSSDKEGGSPLDVRSGEPLVVLCTLAFAPRRLRN